MLNCKISELDLFLFFLLTRFSTAGCDKHLAGASFRDISCLSMACINMHGGCESLLGMSVFDFVACHCFYNFLNDPSFEKRGGAFWHLDKFPDNIWPVP